MKKFTALVLAFLMIAANGAAIFAENVPENGVINIISPELIQSVNNAGSIANSNIGVTLNSDKQWYSVTIPATSAALTLNTATGNYEGVSGEFKLDGMLSGNTRVYITIPSLLLTLENENDESKTANAAITFNSNYPENFIDNDLGTLGKQVVKIDANTSSDTNSLHYAVDFSDITAFGEYKANQTFNIVLRVS